MEKGTGKKRADTVHIVVGVVQSESGTLTYPEDFTIDRTYRSLRSAKARCNELNARCIEAGLVDDDGEWIGDIDEDDCQMYYFVESREIV